MINTERTPNFKIGWILSNKVIALTHFHHEITKEDISAIMEESVNMLKNVTKEFHMIIDNRVAPIDQLYTLEQLQQSSPILSHPYLRYLILIKPLQISTIDLHQETEENGNVILKNVESVKDAIRTLKDFDNKTDYSRINVSFFPKQQ